MTKRILDMTNAEVLDLAANAHLSPELSEALAEAMHKRNIGPSYRSGYISNTKDTPCASQS